MAKICIEARIISATGLPCKSSLRKPQWFAVMWIDPNTKYCTKLVASEHASPSWGTTFMLFAADQLNPEMRELKLTVEVYGKEPASLREHLIGEAIINIGHWEFAGVSSSFELHKGKSGRLRGRVNLAIRVYKETDDSVRLPQTDSPELEQVAATDQNRSASDKYCIDTLQGAATNQNRSASDKATSELCARCGNLDHPTAGSRKPPGQFRRKSPKSYANTSCSAHIPCSRVVSVPEGLEDIAMAAGVMIFGEDLLSGSGYPEGYHSDSPASKLNLH